MFNRHLRQFEAKLGLRTTPRGDTQDKLRDKHIRRTSATGTRCHLALVLGTDHHSDPVDSFSSLFLPAAPVHGPEGGRSHLLLHGGRSGTQEKHTGVAHRRGTQE